MVDDGGSSAHVAAFRSRFPIFEDRILLANNARGALSDAVIAAHAEYLDSWRTLGAPWGLWAGRHEELRARFAALIGAGTHEVAVCPSATVALGSVASGIRWQERPAVVVDDYCFPSIAYLWHAQQAHGARVRRVGPDAAEEIRPEAFDAAIDDRCRLVSVSHVCYKNGHRLDLEGVRDRAHAAGAWLVVDDYQCCGTRSLDVRAAGIDVLVTGTVKFLLGSPGVALLYVREELLDELHPTLTGWFAQEDPDDFGVEAHHEAGDARRFQTGTPDVSAVYDSLAGIGLVAEVGLDRIQAHVDGLTAALMRELDEHGFATATPRDPARRGPQVAIRARDAAGAVEALAQRGIVVSSRDGNIRTAWHYYNTEGDIRALIEALDEIRELVDQPLTEPVSIDR